MMLARVVTFVVGICTCISMGLWVLFRSRRRASTASASRVDYLKPTIASIQTHTMGTSLPGYLNMKIHPLIQERDWNRILVRGEHERSVSRVSIASNEKRDKMFNWMRPTVSAAHCNTLQLHVFPGRDYVQHYASIVATHLSLKGGIPSVVDYAYPTPQDCLSAFDKSNLAELGHMDVVVLGYVEGLERWAHNTWENLSEKHLFSWRTTTSVKGCRIAFLGCRICFWGDIGGNLIRALRKYNKVGCVIYIGKLGSLKANHIPNRSLATGNKSYVDGKLFEWENPLIPHMQCAPSAIIGVHCCLSSVLDETKEWLASKQEEVDFVDPEIGQMAKAALEVDCQYGYIHIISDNLARKYDRDLSNERLLDVRQDRTNLLLEIQDVLSQFFDDWSPSS